MYRPIVALVPPVPAPTTIQSGIGMLLVAHLDEYRLGDVVVAPPVGGSLGVGELVEVVAAGLLGDPFGLGVDLTRAFYEMATAAL